MGTKQRSANETQEEKRPSKRAKLLDEDSDSGEELQDNELLHINKEFARRFEHNKKREEQHRLEEKYGKGATKDEDDSSEDSSSSDETEDEDGFLATAEADAEFEATLRALKEKDPKIYDATAKFYTEAEEGKGAMEESTNSGARKDKTMSLRDYHRKNLTGELPANEEEGEEYKSTQTYAQEQAELKREIVAQMHATNEGDDEELEEDDFLKRKTPAPQVEKHRKQITEADVAAADVDPEKFLSTFLSSRAWAAETGNGFAPMDSDDSDEDERAEAFEEAYNMRFENPALSNTNIISHSRSAVSKYSVRREEANPRKRARDKEREKKEAEKAERNAEKARLRKLRTEEMEAKVAQIREAAGLRGTDTDLIQWAEVLEKDWDDDRWNQELEKRFGEAYYAEHDQSASETEGRKKKKLRKPKFDDDIDIKDIVPDFSEDEPNGATANDLLSGSEDEDISASSGRKSKKEREAERQRKKQASRRDRRIIEQIVENTLPTDAELAANSKIENKVTFRYRETSPTSFGLTTLDILNATDSQLNDFVGLKKLTPFRDPERKVKERKKISKKGRLREWRKGVFVEDGSKEQDGKSGVPQSNLEKQASAEGTRKRNKKSKKTRTSV